MNKFKVGDKVLYKGEMRERSIATVTHIHQNYNGETRIQLIFDDEWIIVCEFEQIELLESEVV